MGKGVKQLILRCSIRNEMNFSTIIHNILAKTDAGLYGGRKCPMGEMLRGKCLFWAFAQSSRLGLCTPPGKGRKTSTFVGNGHSPPPGRCSSLDTSLSHFGHPGHFPCYAAAFFPHYTIGLRYEEMLF